MGRSIVIRVIIVAIFIVAYIFAVAMGLPNTVTGPVIIVAIAVVLFFPTKRKDSTQQATRDRDSDAVQSAR